MTPHIRNYRPRLEKGGFSGKDLEKAQKRTEYLHQVEQDRQMVNRYISGNQLCVADIRDVVPANVRTTLLRWINLANMTDSHRGTTEYGKTFSLERMEGDCVLHCEDGDLRMPKYVFCFEER